MIFYEEYDDCTKVVGKYSPSVLFGDSSTDYLILNPNHLSNKVSIGYKSINEDLHLNMNNGFNDKEERFEYEVKRCYSVNVKQRLNRDLFHFDNNDMKLRNYCASLFDRMKNNDYFQVLIVIKDTTVIGVNELFQ